MCQQSGVYDRVHTYSLTYGQSFMFLYDGTWCQLHHKGTSSANSYANCHYDIRTHSVLKIHSFYRQQVSMALYSLFSVSLIPLYHHRIQNFPMIVKKGGVLFFLRKGEYQEGGLTFCTIYLKNKKLKNLAFEKNVNNKRKGLSGMKQIHFSCL